MVPDYETIKKAAESYKDDMVRFLRAMISHPSESCDEKEVVACIRAEMEKLGFDKVEVDGLGIVIAIVGGSDLCAVFCTQFIKKRIACFSPAEFLALSAFFSDREDIRAPHMERDAHALAQLADKGFISVRLLSPDPVIQVSGV